MPQCRAGGWPGRDVHRDADLAAGEPHHEFPHPVPLNEVGIAVVADVAVRRVLRPGDHDLEGFGERHGASVIVSVSVQPLGSPHAPPGTGSV